MSRFLILMVIDWIIKEEVVKRHDGKHGDKRILHPKKGQDDNARWNPYVPPEACGE